MSPREEPPLLEVRDLSVDFGSGEGAVHAVRHVSFTIERGQTFSLVGESGSGKSVTALSLMQLLPYPFANHPSGSIRFQGQEVIGARPELLKDIRGDKIGIIFQEPMTSLNPLHTVERQVNEMLILHKGLRRGAARARTLELLRMVGIQNPEKRLTAFPHELSGGQRQRVMIAMALANNPDLLIADEPTTALDVTIQAQILELLQEMKSRFGMAIMLITHAMGVVAETAQRVVVMYAGKVIEEAPVDELFANPRHPYTQGLIRSIPRIDTAVTHKARLEAIPGVVPSLLNPPPGCRFAARCRYAMARCREAVPPLTDVGGGHKVACVLVQDELVAAQ